MLSKRAILHYLFSNILIISSGFFPPIKKESRQWLGFQRNARHEADLHLPGIYNYNVPSGTLLREVRGVLLIQTYKSYMFYIGLVERPRSIFGEEDPVDSIAALQDDRIPGLKRGDNCIRRVSWPPMYILGPNMPGGGGWGNDNTTP